jgi:hypothetical protein
MEALDDLGAALACSRRRDVQQQGIIRARGDLAGCLKNPGGELWADIHPPAPGCGELQQPEREADVVAGNPLGRVDDEPDVPLLPRGLRPRQLERQEPSLTASLERAVLERIGILEEAGHDVEPTDLVCQIRGTQQPSAAGLAQGAESGRPLERRDRRGHRAPALRSFGCRIQQGCGRLVGSRRGRRAMPSDMVRVSGDARESRVGRPPVGVGSAPRDRRTDQRMPEVDGSVVDGDQAGFGR